MQDIRCGAGDWRWSGWMDHLMKRHRSVSSNSKCKIFFQRFESSLWNLALTFVQVFAKWYLPFRPLQKHFAVVLHQSEERQFAQLLLSHISKIFLHENGSDMKTLSFTYLIFVTGIMGAARVKISVRCKFFQIERKKLHLGSNSSGIDNMIAEEHRNTQSEKKVGT